MKREAVLLSDLLFHTFCLAFCYHHQYSLAFSVGFESRARHLWRSSTATGSSGAPGRWYRLVRIRHDTGQLLSISIKRGFLLFQSIRVSCSDNVFEGGSGTDSQRIQDDVVHVESNDVTVFILNIE